MSLCTVSEAGAKVGIKNVTRTMKVVELVKISSEAMKVMSASGIRTDDWKHVLMYDEYTAMRRESEKFRYVIAHLAEKYGTSESTVKRIVRRLSREVRV